MPHPDGVGLMAPPSVAHAGLGWSQQPNMSSRPPSTCSSRIAVLTCSTASALDGLACGFGRVGGLARLLGTDRRGVGSRVLMWALSHDALPTVAAYKVNGSVARAERRPRRPRSGTRPDPMRCRWLDSRPHSQRLVNCGKRGRRAGYARGVRLGRCHHSAAGKHERGPQAGSPATGAARQGTHCRPATVRDRAPSKSRRIRWGINTLANLRCAAELPRSGRPASAVVGRPPSTGVPCCARRRAAPSLTGRSPRRNRPHSIVEEVRIQIVARAPGIGGRLCPAPRPPLSSCQ